MWVWILLLVSISIYNTVYGFLPDNVQSKWWIKIPGVLAALILLVYGSYQLMQGYKNSRFAYVSPEGKIVKSRHFPWKISKVIDKDTGVPVYCINERYGDASEVRVVPDHQVDMEVYNAMNGVAVKFFCKPEDVPSFRIAIGP